MNSNQSEYEIMIEISPDMHGKKSVPSTYDIRTKNSPNPPFSMLSMKEINNVKEKRSRAMAVADLIVARHAITTVTSCWIKAINAHAVLVIDH